MIFRSNVEWLGCDCEENPAHVAENPYDIVDSNGIVVDEDPRIRLIGKWQEFVYTRPGLCQIPMPCRPQENECINCHKREERRQDEDDDGRAAHRAPAISDAGR
jgi:hypothetical protein